MTTAQGSIATEEAIVVDAWLVACCAAGKIYPLAEAAQATEDSLKVGRGAKLYLEG